MRFASLRSIVYGCIVVVAACSNGVTAGGPGGPTTGEGIGDPCDAQHTCRAHLTCATDGKCAPSGTTADGQPCDVGDECASGQCEPNRTCGASGKGTKDAPCGGDADCAKGLRCGFDGTSFFPKCIDEGSGDVGKTCAHDSDCFQGLVCTQGKCADFVAPPGASFPKGIPPYVPSPASAWPGAKCKDPVKTAPVTALFRLQGASGSSDDDFFSAPFPNDALRSGGKVSYASFPHDPNPAMGFDAVKRYLDVLESEPFGAYSTVYFRFDGEFDFASVSLDGDDPEIRMVDLTAPSSDASFGQKKGLSVFYTNGRNKYICQNWLAVRPNDGDPFAPNGRYAVIIKQTTDGKAVKAKVDGSIVQQDKDLAALLGSTAPSGALASAYTSYAPLRDYLTKNSIDPAKVQNAVLFTVGDPTKAARNVEASVKAAAAPKVDGWTLCKDGVASPCPMHDGTRGCGAPNPAFDELHALIEIPVFQNGAAPYLASGGDISVQSDAATPIPVVRTEKVCAALTIPKGTAPASGWPIVVYAHGTGGSFRSHAVDGTSAMLSSIDLGSAGKIGFAVLGIDQVGHGPRQCGGGACTSTTDPSNIVFDFANPQAARYTYLQGAADQHALLRAAATLGTVSDGGTNVTLDTSKILFWGHSQGATEGALFLASSGGVPGAILSGEGGGFIQAVLNKTNPVDIKDELYIALSESKPDDVNGYHPVLSLLQQWIDPADPIHFAALDVAPTGAAAPRNVFQPSGTNDTYTPAAVQIPFASAARFAFVDPIVDVKVTTVPFAQGNATIGTNTATAAIRQYTPGAYDGHFVAFQNDTAKTDVTKFLARVANGEVPKIPE